MPTDAIEDPEKLRALAAWYILCAEKPESGGCRAAHLRRAESLEREAMHRVVAAALAARYR